MNVEQLKKRKKGYGWGFLLLLVAIYFVGRSGDLIVEEGGTDYTSAVILVSLRAVIAFALIFCAVMWYVTGRKIKRTKTSGV